MNGEILSIDTIQKIAALEKENKELKEENNKLINEPTTMKMSRIDSVVANIYRNYREQEDYKSRCEKAIEHIKEHQLVYTSQYEEESNFDNHLLDILNGGEQNVN